MSEESHNREKRQLLQHLRSTVEGLLTNGVSNVWNIYGGLNRLHNIMEKIFKHGCRIFDTSVSLVLLLKKFKIFCLFYKSLVFLKMKCNN
jgi:hypothetical protein